MTQMARWAMLGLMLFANVATLYSAAAAPTTTVTQTVTGTEGACDNFYGACVVYTYGGTAAYTTTVYGSSPATTISTPTSATTRVTTTTEKTITVSGTGACNNYEGACVVYGAAESPTTTVYSGSSNGHGGSSDGEIGETSNEGNRIGGGVARLDTGFTSAFAAGVTLVGLSLTMLL